MMIDDSGSISPTFKLVSLFYGRPAIWLGLLLILVLSGCQSGTLPVIKIGLIAPFEGVQRHDGYQRLQGVKLALQQANRNGGVAGYKIELVALNDFAQATESVAQAEELILDPAVRGVIGNWDPALFSTTAPAYHAANLAVIDPNGALPTIQIPPDLSSEQAAQAYRATHALLLAVEQAVQDAGQPTRPAVLHAWEAMP